MKYKTNFTAPLNDKPKIYYTAHPDDYDVWFEKITHDLFKLSECAVFYDPDPENPEDLENYEFDLSQMNLIVIPVTYNFLTRPCRAFDDVFRISQAEHIPFLPVLTDPDQYDLFNAKCGNLQALCPFSKDPTEINYETKLKNYLDDLFLSSEQIQEIKNAFYNYIFLSYRKKDRAKAQKLMKVIHENDRCTDLAIWYDEFLSPGENFNDSIRNVLHKSALFAMAVTPSLVEEPNYVRSIEYPEACRANKAILPVMAEETEMNLIRKAFPTLSTVFSMDAGQLKDPLSIAARESVNHDPRHNYLIGLAYLNGIDVEIDPKRGIHLIEKAAHQDFLPAIEEMITICHKGKGRKSSLSDALCWAEKAAALDPGANSFYRIGMLSEENHQLSTAKDYYLKVLSIILPQLPELRTPESMLDISTMCLNLGNLCIKQKHFPEALKYYEYALQIDQSLAEQSEQTIFLRRLGTTCSKIGRVFMLQNNFSKAYDYYSRALEIYQNERNQFDTPAASRNMAVIFEHLSSLFCSQNNFSEALNYSRKSLEILENLHTQSETPQSQRDLAIVCIKTGDIFRLQNDLSKASAYYQRALDLSRKAVQYDESPDSLINLGLSFQWIGDIYQKENKISIAYDQYLNALEVFQGLNQQHETPDTLRNLAISFVRVADIFSIQNHPEKAEHYYQNALQLYQKLNEQAETAESLYDLAFIYRKSGEVCELQDRPDDARDYFMKAAQTDQKLTQISESSENLRNLAADYSWIGDIFQKQNHQSEALDYYQMSYDIFYKLNQQSETPESIHDLEIINHKLAQAFQLPDFMLDY